MVLDTVVAFVVGLSIGATAIYFAARVIVDVDDFSHALVTALIATLVWIVVGGVVGWIPFLGPLLGLLAYVAVLEYRYPGGLVSAAGVGLVAWITALVALYVLAVLGVTSFGAIGVPGT